MRLTSIATLCLLMAGGGATAQMGPQGDGIWRRSADFGEAQTLDYCYGHQPPFGEYHHHTSPSCLRAELGDNIVLMRLTRLGPIFAEAGRPWKHSAILGWAADGFPIYGPYGYTNPTDASSKVKRLKSSFALRAITTRTTLPTWSLPNHPGISQDLAADQYGPAVSALYPLGRYVEDFDYSAGSGDLDAYNGRFEVTPDYPAGIYAYHVTIDADGVPTFPYIFGGQFAGTPVFGPGATVPPGATTYTGGSSDSLLASWITSNADALVISGYDPTLGAHSTWPTGAPNDAVYTGGAATAYAAAVQLIQYTSTNVYMTSNGLPNFVVGPWFDATSAGAVFTNFPSLQSNYVFPFSRTPALATTLTSTTLGPMGMFVDGVAAFNFLDGGSYSNGQAQDLGGGTVFPTAVTQSPASGERGPVAPGARVLAKAIFGAVLATSTADAGRGAWPTTLGGATVTITDFSGAELSAPIGRAAPDELEFQVPRNAATGFASVMISAGGANVPANLNILATYPNLYADTSNAAVGTVTLVHNGQSKTTSLKLGIPQWHGDDRLLIAVRGSGAGGGTAASATVAGVAVAVKSVRELANAPGVEIYRLRLPRSLSGSGTQDLVVTVGGRVSNTVTLLFKTGDRP